MYKRIRGNLTDAENAFLLIADGQDLSMVFMSFDKILETGSQIDPSLLENARILFENEGKTDLFDSYIASRGIVL